MNDALFASIYRYLFVQICVCVLFLLFFMTEHRTTEFESVIVQKIELSKVELFLLSVSLAVFASLGVLMD